MVVAVAATANPPGDRGPSPRTLGARPCRLLLAFAHPLSMQGQPGDRGPSPRKPEPLFHQILPGYRGPSPRQPESLVGVLVVVAGRLSLGPCPCWSECSLGRHCMHLLLPSVP